MARRGRLAAKAAGVCAALALASCSADGAKDERSERAGENLEQTLEHDGDQRSYLLHVPDSHDPAEPAALVVALHFSGGDAEQMRRLSRLDAIAADHGFLVAYPNGIDGEFNAFNCCGDRDDVGFVKAVVADIGEIRKVDDDRVYVTGMSRGAEMALRAAVDEPGTFAAVGAVSGGFAGAETPKKPVSVVSFAGTDDRSAPAIDGGIDTWRMLAECAEPDIEAISESVTRTASACDDGSEVVHYSVDGMGHSWPGGTGVRSGGNQLGAPDAGLDAADVMWEFFAAHPRES